MIGNIKAQNGNPVAIDKSNFDLSYKPEDNFYKYVNGNWLRNNPIPLGNSSWGTFSVVDQQQAEILKSLIEEIAKDKSAVTGSDRQILRDFYVAAMDSAGIEKQGEKQLQSLFDKIDSIKTRDQLAFVMGWLQLNFCNSGFRFYKNWDPKNSNKIIAFIDQYGGYALPDRKLYYKEDGASENTMQQYRKHIRNMMQFSGYDEKKSKEISDAVVMFETIFAINNMTEEEARDPQLNYNKMDLQGLITIAPGFNWKKYFDALGLKNTSEINVIPPDFFASFGEAVKRNSLSDWKNYLKWCVVTTAAPMLDSRFVNENFNFFERILSGTTDLKSRWQRVVEQEQNYLGWALGKEYVNKYFSPESKETMLAMVDDIKNAFRLRIQNLDWMSDVTKQKAIKKLNKIHVKIGYPDNFPDMPGLKVSNDSYLQNVINISRFSAARQVEAVGKPADKEEWGMPPQEVNAYYNAVQNEIVFPAGILQAPFFDKSFDAAVNYGVIGCVIAHEFTHAFDDQGSQFDGDGNMNNWWTENDLKAFKEKQKLIIDQYNQYTILDTVHLNGELTVGENIADLGGVSISYDAFQMHLKKSGEQNPKNMMDGFTPEQRFFIAWAQLWKQNKTAEAWIRQVNTRTTSPSPFRVLGPLSNLKSFYDAFNIPESKQTKSIINIW
ncbi:MAG: M13 family metallopeptidase [Bacteroidota bacterium]|nr:M13 family metallopeptidase [Bacteroidota bacterium]